MLRHISLILSLIVLLLAPSGAKGQDQYAKKAPAGTALEQITPLACQVVSDDGEDPFLFIKNIIDEAFRHIGARYRRGAKGPHSFDCSGFTGYVFKQFNRLIGASSRDQYAKNTPIKRSEMRRGDLVFFTSPNSGRNVGHVGIVVDIDSVGDDFTFIHASTYRGVTVSRSTEGYYAKRFVGARRVY